MRDYIIFSGMGRTPSQRKKRRDKALKTQESPLPKEAEASEHEMAHPACPLSGPRDCAPSVFGR